MGCCIAIALVIGVVRRAWFGLFPSRAPVQMAAAPPARRPAPGAEGEPDPMPESAPAGAPVGRRGSGWTQGLVSLALALGAYAATLALASSAGVIESSRPVAVWLALAATLIAAASLTDQAPTSASGLVVAGVAWLAVSELDAHVFHVVGHSPVLHAPGPIALALGLAMRGDTLRLVLRPYPSLRSGATQ